MVIVMTEETVLARVTMRYMAAVCVDILRVRGSLNPAHMHVWVPYGLPICGLPRWVPYSSPIKTKEMISTYLFKLISLFIMHD